MDFQFTGDNGGIPNADGVVKFWASLQSTFPQAQIIASPLDDSTRDVQQDDRAGSHRMMGAGGRHHQVRVQ